MSRRLLLPAVIATLVSAPLARAPLAAQTDVQRFGRVSFQNSGSAAAQPAFLRGLALLHNFQYPEAAAAFREAEAIDPGFAMAYWGEAMTYNHGVWNEQDSAAARAVLAKLGATPAQRLARAPTAREKAYLATLDVLYGTGGTKQSRDTAYAAAAASLAAKYPADDDAQLFHALALLALPRVDSTYERAGRIAERVMRAHPDHPGALHYVIHAYDDPAHATTALPAARAYSTIAANAPHAQHMVSHIFVALGMWDDVVKANEISVHMHDTPAAVLAAECGHAGLWLHYAYLEQGRRADATRMLDDCRAHSAESPELARGFAAMRLRQIIDGGAAADDVATLPDSLARGPMPRFFLAYGDAYDALRRRDTAAARPQIERMAAARAAILAAPRRPNTDLILGITSVAIDEMRGLVQAYGGDREGALATLRAAADREDAMPFAFGPPDVEKPARELLAEVLLAMHQRPEARAEFTRTLARTPERSPVLLGLARADLVTGDSVAARGVYARLAANWHRADPTTPALDEARQGRPAHWGGSPGAPAPTPAPTPAPALTGDQLIALSVLPLPEGLRAGAGVVTLDEQRRPVELRKSTNGMVCVRIVPGEGGAAWDARCYHETFAPLFFRAGELRAAGVRGADVDARIDAELKSGTLRAPSGPTSGYRLLGPASAYDPATGKATAEMRFWQSIHMPYRTAKEFGVLTEQELPGVDHARVPFAMASGTWWAHVMIMHDAP